MTSRLGIDRLGMLILVAVLPGLLVVAIALSMQGPLAKGLQLGGLAGLIMSFMTGLLTHWCYTRRTLTLALATVLVTMSARLLSVLFCVLMLRSAEPTYFLSSVVTMTALIVLALLADAVFLALPPRAGPEETARG